ncbi:MAG TPA: acyl carrier protein [Candidatus Andersenbacteria bacterium]|nr:acyl carrier protein [Candidatus Andersenbacteria bacterium]
MVSVTPIHDCATIVALMKESLIETLSLDDDIEISLGQRLTSDLGAESIDFLDLVFRLEKKLGIRIPRAEIFPPDYSGGMGLNNQLDEEIFGRIRTSFSFIPSWKHVRLQESTVGDVFTVRLICQSVAHVLGVKWVDPA